MEVELSYTRFPYSSEPSPASELSNVNDETNANNSSSSPEYGSKNRNENSVNQSYVQYMHQNFLSNVTPVNNPPLRNSTPYPQSVPHVTPNSAGSENFIFNSLYFENPNNQQENHNNNNNNNIHDKINHNHNHYEPQVQPMLGNNVGNVNIGSSNLLQGETVDFNRLLTMKINE